MYLIYLTDIIPSIHNLKEIFSLLYIAKSSISLKFVVNLLLQI